MQYQSLYGAPPKSGTWHLRRYMPIAGLATKEGTTRYIERFPQCLDNSAYRRFRKLRASSVGIGTYIGAPTPEDDKLYEQAIAKSILSGCNLIDTALNYRHMLSERVIREVLEDLIDSGKAARDEILICTKGGYLPYDISSGMPAAEYLRKTFIASGLVAEEEAVSIQHSLNPKFLDWSLNQSLENMNVASVDVYYLHNPEAQLGLVDRETFHQKIEEAFKFLEGKAKAGVIGCYGLATWNGFRVDEQERSFLSLSELLKIANKVGGPEHHFGAVQLPLNLSRTEALTKKNQKIAGKQGFFSMTAAAAEVRMPLFISATLDQGRLVSFPPPSVTTYFGKLEMKSHYAVQFSRSCPSVVAALVGMKNPSHVDEILRVQNVLPASPENFVRFF